jgi:hypothetical protein
VSYCAALEGDKKGRYNHTITQSAGEPSEPQTHEVRVIELKSLESCKWIKSCRRSQQTSEKHTTCTSNRPKRKSKNQETVQPVGDGGAGHRGISSCCTYCGSDGDIAVTKQKNASLTTKYNVTRCGENEMKEEERMRRKIVKSGTRKRALRRG